MDKHLTTAELWVEHTRTVWVTAMHGSYAWGGQLLVLQRFIDLPHAGDNGYL